MNSSLKIRLLTALFFGAIILNSNYVLSQQKDVWIAPTYSDSLRNPVNNDPSAIKAAKKIYDNVCWSCHGLQGKGNGPASVTCNPKPADHTSLRVQRESDGALFWKITFGRGNMQPYVKLLSAKQRWSLVNYIRTLSAGNEVQKLDKASQ